MNPYPPGFIKNLRDRIGSVIAVYSANEVPAVCRRYGLGDGQRDEAFSGKVKYVTTRLLELANEEVIAKARTVAHEEGDKELLRPPAPIKTKASTPLATGFHPPKRAYYAERMSDGPTRGRLNLSALK